MHSVPDIWAEGAREVSPITATLKAHVLRKEYDRVHTHFEYRRVGAADWQASPAVAHANSGVNGVTVSGLDPATEYVYRPVLTYTRGRVTGDSHTFTTPDSLASFTGAPVQGVAPLTVTFTATKGSPATYLWDFGDGVTNTLRSPVHTYEDVGFYTVSLTVTTAEEGATLRRMNYVRVWKAQLHLPMVLRNR
jgi:PKD repeat protein